MSQETTQPTSFPPAAIFMVAAVIIFAAAGFVLRPVAEISPVYIVAILASMIFAISGSIQLRTHAAMRWVMDGHYLVVLSLYTVTPTMLARYDGPQALVIALFAAALVIPPLTRFIKHDGEVFFLSSSAAALLLIAVYPGWLSVAIIGLTLVVVGGWLATKKIVRSPVKPLPAPTMLSFITFNLVFLILAVAYAWALVVDIYDIAETAPAGQRTMTLMGGSYDAVIGALGQRVGLSVLLAAVAFLTVLLMSIRMEAKQRRARALLAAFVVLVAALLIAPRPPSAPNPIIITLIADTVLLFSVGLLSATAWAAATPKEMQNVDAANTTP